MAKLRRELGLRDVTLFAIACMVSTRWIPAAAHAGPGSVTLWLLAAILFAAPLAVAVGTLSVKYPGAGGLYLWTRHDFGTWHAFLGSWVYWIGLAFWFPSAAMFYMSSGLDLLGPPGGHWGENRLYLMVVSLGAIWLALGTNIIGMKIGKWTENIGGASAWALAALLAVVAAVAWKQHGSATPLNIRPNWSWDTVNFWSSIAYGMSGVELAGIIGSEIHDPERTLPRAGWIASGFVTFFYVAGTVSLLVLMPSARVSEMNGLAQASAAASQVAGAAWLVPVFAVLVLASAVGQFGGIGTSVSRLPYAAGDDGLLPAAMCRVHPRFGTPHISMLLFGAVSSFLLLIAQLGDTLAAAYQVLVSLMVIAGFLPYVYIFGSAWKAGKRISALSGWLVTAIAILTSIVPTDRIVNIWLFEGKLLVGTAAIIASAWFLFRRYNGLRAT
ncbi:MAG TPA: APC family permease [Bryobacteraceae bacterium]|nr:APC family permease [Bryobacteraceae bacterium]